MAQSYFLCMVLHSIVHSIILTFCVLYRPVGLTIPYLLLLLCLPFVPVATPKSIRGHTGYYFSISITITMLIFLVQIAFQILLATLGEEIISTCDFLGYILRHLGVIKFNGMPIISIFEWFLPDTIMLVASTSIYLILRGLSSVNVEDIESSGRTDVEPNRMSTENYNILKKIGVFLSMVALLVTSTLQPSVPGAIYFIVFLGAATWWACYRELERAFSIICRIVLFLLAIHIVALLSYQTPWPQEYFTDNSTSIRFLGFSSLYIFPPCNVTDQTSDIRNFFFNQNANLKAFLNPVAILFCFFTLAISSGMTLNTKVYDETMPLIRKSSKSISIFNKRKAAILSGAYYLFDDMDENLELNLLFEKPNVAVEDDVLKRNIYRKMTFEGVLVGNMKSRRPADSKASVKTHKLRSISLPEEPIPEEDPLPARATISEPITSTGFETSSPIQPKDEVDFTQPDGQKPTTSRATVKILEGSDDEFSESSVSDKGERSFWTLITSFISGLMVSITLRLYKMSRNYRYVTKVLSKEKKELKAEKDFGQGHRIGTGNVWAPLPSILRTRGESKSPSITELTTPNNDDNDLAHDEQNGDLKISSVIDDLLTTTIAHLLRPTMFSTKKEEKSPEEERRTSAVPEIRILAPSLERGLDESFHRSYSKDDSDRLSEYVLAYV